MTLCDLGYTVDLLDAVRIAVGTGDMPREEAESAVFGVEMLLRNVAKDLRAEWASADVNESEPP